jgi:FtsP/CotA-like multicopper oxidase with cupredoxin domain
MVNDQLFKFPDPNPLVMELGEIVQWTTDNAHSHPMHIHTQPYQLTAFNLSNMYAGTKMTNFFQVSGDTLC